MPFQPERLIGLRKAKGIRTQEELEAICGIVRSTINRYEKGTKTPSPDALETLAKALDTTMDYLHGLGNHYEAYDLAAVQMSFDVFHRDPRFSPEQKERCRKALGHEAAPRTAAGWRALSEMIDLATSHPPQPGFGLVRGGRC